MSKFLTLCLILILSSSAFAQDFSNKGKDFWLCYPAHIDGNLSAMGLYITSDVNATGTIFVGTIQIPFTLVANQVVRKFLGPGAGGDAPNTSVQLGGQQDGINISSGIRVVSTANVVVFAHIIRSARSGATLVLPTKVWGREYIVPSHRSTGGATGEQGYGELCVMAREPNTTVEIIPKVASRNGARAADVPFTITLTNPGDVYQLQFTRQADISGTVVKSITQGTEGCKPIGVFSATTWTGLDCNGASGGDNLFQQIFPTGAWGKEFFTSPLKKVYSNNADNNVDIIKVFVNDLATVVTKTENGITTTLSGLIAGSYYQYTTSSPTFIQSSKPVQVVQIITSQTCGAPQTQSDPEMVVLNSVEQTINNITVFSAHQNFVPTGQSAITTHYFNIITKTDNTPSFKINGNTPVSAWLPIPSTNYSYLKENVSTTAATNPVFNLKADSGFTAIAYGFGGFESYGYNAGTNVKDLYQFVTVQNPLATVNFPSACKGTPFFLYQSLPYKPLSITWDFSTSGLPNPPFTNYTNNTPSTILLDSTFIANKWVYRYKNPIAYTVNTVGTYPITVTVNNPTSDGCSGIQDIDYDLQVFGAPIANFNWIHNGCVTDTVYFRENSTPLELESRPVIKWQWNFHDNTTDTIVNPKKLYTTPGTDFPVKLVLITDVGCISDTVTKFITITSPPVSTIVISSPICAGKVVTVTPTSSISIGTIAKWVYNWGDGTPTDTLTTNAPITHIYTTTGVYTINHTVISSSNCTSVLFPLTFTVNAVPVANFTLPVGACLPIGAATFTNTTTIANGTLASNTYVWNFGNGSPTTTTTNGTVNYSAVGPYNVNLQATSLAGCVHDTTIVFNNVYPRPNAGISGAPETCINTPITLTSTSTPVTGTTNNNFWDNGSGTFAVGGSTLVVSFTTNGIKTIRHYITTTNGCTSDTATYSLIVNALPTASFSYSNLGRCARAPITFVQNSTSSNGIITEWSWNFGDGSPLVNATTGANQIHAFAAEGLYTVSLVVKTDKGCLADTFKLPITITATPVASFIPPGGICLPSGFAQFTNNTTITNGTIATVTYNWNFGDASPISTATSPNHIYSGVGPYTVTLTATSAIGCVDDSVQIVSNIFARPNAAITGANEACVNSSISLTSASTPINGTIAEYWWDNGSGTFTLGTNTLNVTFATTGNKIIRHYIKTSNGCISDTASKPVFVNALPIAALTANNTRCQNTAITFNSTGSTSTDGTINEWAWDFGDGSAVQTFTNGNPVTYTYAAPGIYTITLTIKTTKGCTSAATPLTITVSPRPVAQFNLPANVCLPVGAASFTNTTTIAGGSVATNTYVWTFASGVPNTTTTTNGNTIYNAVGNYNVTLQATSNFGCVHDTTLVFGNVRPRPTAGISVAPEVCIGDSLQLTSTSVSNGVSITDNNWLFVETNQTSTQLNPKMAWITNGTKTIKHWITTSQGCVSDTATTTIYVNSLPTANFTVSAPQCEGKNITFTNTSTTTDGVISNWSWDFGNGAPNTITAGPHTVTYPTTGTYTATLNVVTSKGCANIVAASKPVIVSPNPIVRMYLPEICLNDPIAQFTDSSQIADGTEAQFTYNWQFGDPNATPANPNTSSIRNPTHSYSQASNYNMSLTVTSNNGCSTS